ncbi:PspC domain-containing protein [Acinetobacter chinensis]|uniref:PspC domain-containing protein n=1 Tax=Acinetobacter chinensis TaxID=2004650 RepID=A0A3B7LSI6_9GAMM|nr:PspC domain-containing protein [Acinetobacter chinensis]AXY55636.1 PspC domain-containing protein [Acinetobacter chinensis]MDV2469671.1 PspC domain-containing protein [Acinetobacter chinensis]
MANIGLYRSYRQNMVAGVMGGIAERFGWNANLLRIIFVLISIMSAAFPGILVYLILWLVIPKQNGSDAQNNGYARPIRTVQNESGSDRY